MSPKTPERVDLSNPGQGPFFRDEQLVLTLPGNTFLHTSGASDCDVFPLTTDTPILILPEGDQTISGFLKVRVHNEEIDRIFCIPSGAIISAARKIADNAKRGLEKVRGEETPSLVSILFPFGDLVVVENALRLLLRLEKVWATEPKQQGVLEKLLADVSTLNSIPVYK